MKEEINLREILEIMLKQKWIIIITTVLSMLISAFISLFVLKPTYETYSIVRIQSVTDKVANISIYEESLKSASTLNSVIEKNQLDKSKYSIHSIREMFTLETNPETNLMKITVKGYNPSEVTQLANLLAYELGVRIEISDRTDIVVASQIELEQLEDEIEITKAKLLEAQEQLKNTPEKQTTRQVLAGNDFLRSVVQERMNVNSSVAAVIEMESESINPAYTELQSKVAQAEIDLNSLLKHQENLTQQIEFNQSRINELEIKSSNNKLNENKSIRILDGTNAIYINPSLQPEQPSGPNVIYNVAVSMVIGFIISLIYIFLKQYMNGNLGKIGNKVEEKTNESVIT